MLGPYKNARSGFFRSFGNFHQAFREMGLVMGFSGFLLQIPVRKPRKLLLLFFFFFT